MNIMQGHSIAMKPKEIHPSSNQNQNQNQLRIK